MKKNGILNADISRVMSYMGHTDRICIGDCGLPVPDEVERIDLALKFGVPKFIETLKTVADEMRIEKIILASEIKEMNPELLKDIENYFKGTEITPEIEFTAHDDFKKLTEDCKAIIRTGENTPYANIIMQSACIF